MSEYLSCDDCIYYDDCQHHVDDIGNCGEFEPLAEIISWSDA
ncbi:MAG: hypothetical protein ACFFDN_47700 [Candidatus Hodarchaeota archaeon]